MCLRLNCKLSGTPDASRESKESQTLGVQTGRDLHGLICLTSQPGLSPLSAGPKVPSSMIRLHISADILRSQPTTGQNTPQSLSLLEDTCTGWLARRRSKGSDHTQLRVGVYGDVCPVEFPRSSMYVLVALAVPTPMNMCFLAGS